MDEKLVKISLIIFVVGIFAFAGSMAWFTIFKERVCKININGSECYERYGTFMHNEFGSL